MENSVFTDPNELARRAAMLKEAADALPTGSERNRLLAQLHVFEEQLRAYIHQRLDAAE